MNKFEFKIEILENNYLTVFDNTLLTGIEVAKDLENDTKINLLESRLQKAENTLEQKEISRIESEYQAQNTAKNKK